MLKILIAAELSIKMVKYLIILSDTITNNWPFLYNYRLSVFCPHYLVYCPMTHTKVIANFPLPTSYQPYIYLLHKETDF